VAFLRHGVSFVRSGGLVAFQDFDVSVMGCRLPDVPTCETCGKAFTAVFERAGLQPTAGSLLYTWFLAAGLPVPEVPARVSGGRR
jgi:hypothetical protein